MEVEDYTWIPFTVNKDLEILVSDKEEEDRVDGIAFMWESPTWKKKIGSADTWIINEEQYEKIELKTLHTYVYHGLFKPTLREVYKYLNKEGLELPKKIYVQTRYDCFSEDERLHEGKTTILIPKN